MDIKGKRLLVLGGTKIICEIVEKAKELGLLVIVADYDENSPAKRLADKSSMVSATDVDAVVQLIKQERIDGVLTGFIELLLPYYQQICKKAGLPCYATKEHIEFGTEKIKFKNLCRDFDIPVVREYQLTPEISKEDLDNISFPVLLKPSDNTAGRGINICNNADELIDNYPKSLAFSPGKRVLVEEYTPWEEVTIFYAAQNGKVFLTGMADRYVQNRQNGSIPLPVAYIFASKYLDDFLNTLDHNVVRMFESIGVENGMIFIQSFVKDGNFVFYEMGFRLTATLEYHVLSLTNQINILEELIYFSVSGKMSQKSLHKRINLHSQKAGGNITFLVKPGEIGRIEGVEEILRLPEVSTCFLSYSKGDKIPKHAVGTLLQVMARVLFVVNEKSDLAKIINKIHELFKVYSTDGENMLLSTFDPNVLTDSTLLDDSNSN